MKKLFYLFFLLTQTIVYSQNLKNYKASNETNYKKGDTIIMAEPTGANDEFKSLWITGSNQYLNKTYTDIPVIIKKIKQMTYRGVSKVLFKVNGGNIVPYTLDIERAIKLCEIKECKKEILKEVVVKDKYEKLREIKKLYDNGVLTKEEFEKEKKEILN